MMKERYYIFEVMRTKRKRAYVQTMMMMTNMKLGQTLRVLFKVSRLQLEVFWKFSTARNTGESIYTVFVAR